MKAAIHPLHCRCRACAPIAGRRIDNAGFHALAAGIVLGAISIELAALAAGVASPLRLLIGAP